MAYDPGAKTLIDVRQFDYIARFILGDNINRTVRNDITAVGIETKLNRIKAGEIEKIEELGFVSLASVVYLHDGLGLTFYCDMGKWDDKLQSV